MEENGGMGVGLLRLGGCGVRCREDLGKLCETGHGITWFE